MCYMVVTTFFMQWLHGGEKIPPSPEGELFYGPTFLGREHICVH